MAASVLSNPRLRRFAVAAGLAFLLAGCEGVGAVQTTDTDMEKVGELLFHAITDIGSSESVSRQRAGSVPYASLGVRLGSSDEAMFVLGTKSGSDLLWIGGTQLAITTREGRIIKTVGFDHNLSGFQATDKAVNSAEGERSYLYDFAENSHYGIVVKCSRQNVGREQIMILGVPHDTMHLVEDCAAPQLDWNFRNEFWSDSSGFVWQSRQYVAPDLDALSLEVLRPAQ